jgi:hypothetical protein
MELESERWKAQRNGWANEGERGGANPGREREREMKGVMREEASKRARD